MEVLVRWAFLMSEVPLYGGLRMYRHPWFWGFESRGWGHTEGVTQNLKPERR